MKLNQWCILATSEGVVLVLDKGGIECVKGMTPGQDRIICGYGYQPKPFDKELYERLRLASLEVFPKEKAT